MLGLVSATTTAAPRTRPGVDRDSVLAQRALHAFSRARGLAARARRAGEHELAADIDTFAWDLITQADPVRLSVARSHLDISDPTARDWTARGILQRTQLRPVRVSLKSVARAAEHARRLRAAGERDLARSIEAHIRFEESLQSAELQNQLARLRAARAPAPHGHRTAELRSLALHRRIAEQLDEPARLAARRRVRGWLRAGGPVDRAHAGQWERLLARPLPEIRRALAQDSETMRELRQDTPFAGLLNDRERADALLEIRR